MTDHDRTVMSHTYALHLIIRAENDAAAVAMMLELAERPDVGARYVTDADDWAEHLPEDGACWVCRLPVDRERTGTGLRTHHDCDPKKRVYPIVDIG